MVKTPQRGQPIPVAGNEGSPQFIDPDDACFTLVFPPLNRIHVEQIPIRLADENEQIVLLCESNRLEPGIYIRKLSRNIFPEKPAVPFLTQTESSLWF